MLHFILGTAGTGKTTRLIEEIHRAVLAGRRAILLIPEQFSFEGEKLVFRALGPQLSLGVEVLSFTRLCDAIFRRLGGLSGLEVTRTAKYLLASVVLEELREDLRFYRKSAANIDFLDTFLAACSELKMAGITPERLQEFSADCTDAQLAEKTRELAALYAAFQHTLEKGYRDPEDSLLRACTLLGTATSEADGDFLADCDVFVDGFAAFMSAEYALLRCLMERCGHVWFAMTADTAFDNTHGVGVFSAVQATIQSLLSLARRAGVPAQAPLVLTQPHRYAAAALAHLSQHFWAADAVPFTADATDAVRLFAAADLYEETEHAAAAIAALIRQGGRYRDIAVVARDTEPYLRALALHFPRYGIPYFVDAPSDMENQPLIGAVLTALEVLRSGYDSQTVLTLAKSPLLGLDAEAVARLENYVYLWGIRGGAWRLPFAANPRGFSDAYTPEDEAFLAEINDLRRRITEPLQKLMEAVSGGFGRGFAHGIYGFLQEIHADEQLTAYAQRLPQGAREAFLDENAQLWDMLMGVLDVFGQILGSVKMPWRRLCELFRLAAEGAELGNPPRTLDQIIVGKADRIRPGAVQTVFVLGANEGIFPPAAPGGGLFQDAERLLMIEAGLGVAPPSLRQVILEQFFAYFALTLPSHRLFVSFTRRDLKGGQLLPSPIIRQLTQLFPGIAIDEQEADPLARVANAGTAAVQLAQKTRTHGDSADSVWQDSLHAFLAQQDSGLLARLERAAHKAPHRLTEPAHAKALFGTQMRLSPSRVERYYRCAFSYFAVDGLRLHARRKVEFSPLESGSVIHHVLHVMVQRHSGRGLCDLTLPQLEAETAQVINEYLNTRVENNDLLPARFQYLFTRLCGMLARLLAHMGREFAQSRFEPIDFEAEIRTGGDWEPLKLQTADGTTVTVEGIVDRIDVMKTRTGSSYVRVIDYKSGRKDFKLQDILAGLNLQMLLYLFTIQEHGGTALPGEILPAGVLYMPVREPFVSGERGTEDEAVLAEHAKNLRMSGLLLEDIEAISGMEADMSGIFIPARLKKDGTLDSKSSLANLAQMGRLAQKVKEQIIQMASALTNGNIDAQPMETPDYPACAYCDYRAVCGFEEGDAVREIAKMDREAVLKLLEKESAE